MARSALLAVLAFVLLSEAMASDSLYVPRVTYRGKCERIMRDRVFTQDGCSNEITLPACRGFCTSYETPYMYSTRVDAQQGHPSPTHRYCDCCRAVKRVRTLLTYPLNCPNGTQIMGKIPNSWIKSCSCVTCPALPRDTLG